MKMFGAGMAAGFGGKFYQQVMLFETKQTFDNFVNKGWEATSEAGVVAGRRARRSTRVTTGHGHLPAWGEGAAVRRQRHGIQILDRRDLTQ